MVMRAKDATLTEIRHMKCKGALGYAKHGSALAHGEFTLLEVFIQRSQHLTLSFRQIICANNLMCALEDYVSVFEKRRQF